jgi:hypothetical protein
VRRGLDLSREGIGGRLRRASALADLRVGHRLDAKIGLSPSAVTARLKLASALRDLCARLESIRKP